MNAGNQRVKNLKDVSGIDQIVESDVDLNAKERREEEDLEGDNNTSDVNAKGSKEEAVESDAEVNFYIDEGEGMMSENAKQITELRLKKGKKRKLNPEGWESNRKRKYRKSSEGQVLR